MKYHLVAGLAMAGTAYGLDLNRVRRDGGEHHHHPDHEPARAAAASSGYSAPAPAYSAPAPAYEQPAAPVYEEPSPGYSAPATGYEEPSGYAAPSGYGAPAAGGLGGLDLSQLLIPILIIAGLALLFPSVQTVPVGTGRKRRDTGGEDESITSNMIERVQDMYMSLLESEECMERVACEIGGLATDAGISKTIFTLAEPYVPGKYSKFVKKFNQPKDCHKIKCGF